MRDEAVSRRKQVGWQEKWTEGARATLKLSSTQLFQFCRESVSDGRIDDGDEFASDGDEGDDALSAVGDQSFVKDFDAGIVAPCGHEEHGLDLPPAATETAACLRLIWPSSGMRAVRGSDVTGLQSGISVMMAVRVVSCWSTAIRASISASRASKCPRTGRIGAAAETALDAKKEMASSCRRMLRTNAVCLSFSQARRSRLSAVLNDVTLSIGSLCHQ